MICIYTYIYIYAQSIIFGSKVTQVAVSPSAFSWKNEKKKHMSYNASGSIQPYWLVLASLNTFFFSSQWHYFSKLCAYAAASQQMGMHLRCPYSSCAGSDLFFLWPGTAIWDRVNTGLLFPAKEKQVEVRVCLRICTSFDMNIGS